MEFIEYIHRLHTSNTCIEYQCIQVVGRWFSNQNKLWNMLQGAFDHAEAFFNIPKGWKASFEWVVDVINFEILHFFKNVKIYTFSKNVKISSGAEIRSFSRWIRIWSPFRLKPSKITYFRNVNFCIFYIFHIFCIFGSAGRAEPFKKLQTFTKTLSFKPNGFHIHVHHPFLRLLVLSRGKDGDGKLQML